MSAISILNLYGIFICVITGVVVFLLNPRRPLNTIFMLMSFSFAYWIFVNHCFLLSHTVKEAVFWINLFAFWHISVSLLLHFILVFTEKTRFLKKPATFVIVYAPAGLFMALDIWKSFTIGYPVHMPWGWTVHNPSNFVFYLDIAWACCAAVFAAVLLIQYYFSAAEKLKKKQAKYVGLGFLVPIVSSIISLAFSMFSGVWDPEYVTCSFMLTSILIAYGIWKHRLFSLTPAFAAENIISTMTDGLLIVNNDGMIQTVNNAVCRMLGYKKQELLGRNANDLFSDQKTDRPISDKTWFCDVQTAGNISDIPTSLVTKSGAMIPASLSASTLLDREGIMHGMVYICRDITERKNAQEALIAAHDELEKNVTQRTAQLAQAENELFKARKLESMGVLAAGIASDFSAILSEIVTHLFSAKIHLKAGDEAYRHIIEAEAATFRASRLTKQLLTFSKGGAPVKEQTSIKRLVEDSVGFCLSGSNATYRIDMADDLLPVNIDRGQIDQVVSNLVINADQAMKEGGTIVISARNMAVDETSAHLSSHLVNASQLEAGTYVCLSITDEGTGIVKENLDKIFDPYFTTKENCNGLGLSAAYSIIKKHNGYITVDSEVGKGTTFCVYLPSMADMPAAAAQDNASEEDQELLVDDENSRE
jgi:PAS domain S-box-containing protein